jgi:hypothetical protein
MCWNWSRSGSDCEAIAVSMAKPWLARSARRTDAHPAGASPNFRSVTLVLLGHGWMLAQICPMSLCVPLEFHRQVVAQ